MIAQVLKNQSQQTIARASRRYGTCGKCESLLEKKFKNGSHIHSPEPFLTCPNGCIAIDIGIKNQTDQLE